MPPKVNPTHRKLGIPPVAFSGHRLRHPEQPHQHPSVWYLIHLCIGDLWVAISRFDGLEHWETVAGNCIITPPALGSGDAVEVLDPETGETRHMQPHIKEYVPSDDEDCVEVRVDLHGTQ